MTWTTTAWTTMTRTVRSTRGARTTMTGATLWSAGSTWTTMTGATLRNRGHVSRYTGRILMLMPSVTAASVTASVTTTPMTTASAAAMTAASTTSAQLANAFSELVMRPGRRNVKRLARREIGERHASHPRDSRLVWIRGNELRIALPVPRELGGDLSRRVVVLDGIHGEIPLSARARTLHRLAVREVSDASDACNDSDRSDDESCIAARNARRQRRNRARDTSGSSCCGNRRGTSSTATARRDRTASATTST